MTMRDIDSGKLAIEEMNLEPFLDCFPVITSRTAELVGRGESPDFEALVDGRPMGIELTEIRDCAEPSDYLAEVYRIAAKKAASFHTYARLATRPIMLLCHSDELPFYDFRSEMERLAFWDDFDPLGFAEIWLMDLSERYFSARDPRRPADLFGLVPARWRGFHRCGGHGRKPFG